MLTGYARESIFSSFGKELMADLARVTAGGAKPFVAGADWNCTPQQMEDSGWLSSLKAAAVVTGSVTGSTREIDFYIVSMCLLSAVRGIEANDNTPFATHASVRLVLSRDDQDLKS